MQGEGKSQDYKLTFISPACRSEEKRMYVPGLCPSECACLAFTGVRLSPSWTPLPRGFPRARRLRFSSRPLVGSRRSLLPPPASLPHGQCNTQGTI